MEPLERSAADDTPGSAAGPPGFGYVSGFLGESDHRELVARLASLPFHEVRMRGVAARRTVVHFGWDYGYESWRITPTAPMPDFLAPLRERAAVLAELSPEALEQVLVARYPPGAGIGWHRDAPMFGPVVVGVSLGAPAVMRFRRGRTGAWELRRVALAPGSAYVLSGPARAAWQHSIPPVDALRYSVTFRTVRSRAVS
jgi:alkylated DNA repair protein (DNA oxidative demethylase)